MPSTEIKTRKNTDRLTLFLGYVALIYALFLGFTILNGLAGYEDPVWRFFYAFTQQSNIICWFWFMFFGLGAFGAKSLYRIATNNTVLVAITVYISITFFIVALVLDPIYTGAWEPMSHNKEFIMHNATPIMMWLYLFLAPGHGPMRSRDSIIILVYPLLYLVANLFIGANVNYLNGNPAYAYNFINPNNYANIGIFIAFMVALVAIYAGFGLGLMRLRKKFPHRSMNRHNRIFEGSFLAQFSEGNRTKNDPSKQPKPNYAGRSWPHALGPHRWRKRGNEPVSQQTQHNRAQLSEGPQTGEPQ